MKNFLLVLPQNPPGLDTGAIVGISIGSVAVLIILIVIIFFVRKKIKKPKEYPGILSKT